MFVSRWFLNHNSMRRNYIHNFLSKQCNKDNIVESDKSTYYKIDNRVIRVSDHPSFNSSGSISIITPSNKGVGYIVHLKENNKLLYFDNFSKLKSFLTNYLMFIDSFVVGKKEKLKVKNNKSDINIYLSKILKIHPFTEGQASQIANFMKSVTK